jgi:chromosomal replication initiation ATPase DnaA
MSLNDDARPDELRATIAAMQEKLDEHEQLLERLTGILSAHQPMLREIIEAVADFYRIEAVEIRSPSRAHTVTIPRMIVYYLARRLTRMSLQDIANRLGRRDHGTIINGVERITRKLHRDDLLRDDIDILRMRIGEKVHARLHPKKRLS